MIDLVAYKGREESASESPVTVELAEANQVGVAGPAPVRSRLRRSAAVATLLALVALMSAVLGDDGPAPPPPPTSTPEARQPPRGAPVGAIAAQRYATAPSSADLRTVLTAIGGLEEMTVGVAEGSFDLVTFDPRDDNRMLATLRSGYGRAENQDRNQSWLVADGDVVQTLWDRETPHDFVHFNADGTTAVWTRARADFDFGPRTVAVLGRGGEAIATSSAPVFANRYAVDSGTVFALTGDPDWYSPSDRHGELIADEGERQVLLASAGGMSWIDVPVPGALVAYPDGPGGATRVWDTTTLEPLVEHPLAGHAYGRIAVAVDAGIGVGIRFDGRLEPFDLATGTVGDPFGDVDTTGVEHAIRLAADGQVAYTVERSGAVRVWFVGDDDPIAELEGASGDPRWLPEARSARLASALAPDGTRLALRTPASPGVDAAWQIVDTDVASWLERARDLGAATG